MWLKGIVGHTNRSPVIAVGLIQRESMQCHDMSSIFWGNYTTVKEEAASKVFIVLEMFHIFIVCFFLDHLCCVFTKNPNIYEREQFLEAPSDNWKRWESDTMF